MSNLANERFFPAEPDWVFAALLHALLALGWSVKSSDQYGRSASFSTPMSGFSWGAGMSGNVIASSEGALVRVTGAAKVRPNVTAGGPERKNITRLLDAVSHELQVMLEEDSSGSIGTPLDKSPTETSTSLVDQLAKLAQLRDAGSLTDTEFAAAKARLLD